MDILSTLVDASLATERVRIQTQIRKSHLALDGRDDPETDKLLEREIDLEEYVDGRVAIFVNQHPAAPWFLRVRGIGKENIGKVVGPIDILKCTSVSTMWKFAGYAPVPVDVTCKKCEKVFTPVFEPAPEDEDVRRDVARCPKCGTMNAVKWVAEKRIKGGGKLHYNSQLRTMCYRLGTSILRAGLRQKCENDHLFGSSANRQCENGHTFNSTKEQCPECGSTNFTLICPKCGSTDVKSHAISRFAG